MTSKRFEINRAINNPVTFRGLKAQYILYTGGLLVGNLLLFATLYITGVKIVTCVVVALGLATGGVTIICHHSRKYGEFGKARKRAAKRLPLTLRFTSRKTFTQLTNIK